MKLQSHMKYSAVPALEAWKAGASTSRATTEELQMIDAQIVSARLISQQLKNTRYRTLRTALEALKPEAELRNLALSLYDCSNDPIDNATAAKFNQVWRNQTHAAMMEADMSVLEDPTDVNARTNLHSVFDTYLNGNEHWSTFSSKCKS